MAESRRAKQLAFNDVSEWTLEQVDQYISDRLEGQKVCTDLHMFSVLTRLREMLESLQDEWEELLADRF